jgi:hypothetical protein
LFVGVLIALTVFPTVPITDEVLAVVSVGLPTGLGIYWASAHSGGSGRTRAGRFAAAMAGAVIGAWLGFNVTSAAFGAIAPVLAIVGATAGANLALIAFDIAIERSTRRSPVREAATARSGGCRLTGASRREIVLPSKPGDRKVSGLRRFWPR